MNEAPGGPTFELGRLWRFTQKELREVLRDRRTIMTLVLMPLLLYPLLAIAMQQLFQANAVPGGATEFRLGFATNADLEQFDHEILPAARRAMYRSAGNQPRWLGENEPDLKAKLVADPENELQDANVHIVLQKEEIAAPPNWPERLPFAPACYVWRLTVLEGSPESAAAFRHIRGRFILAHLDFLETHVQPLPFNANPVPTLWVTEMIPSPPRKSAGVMSTLIPLILVLMTITGAVYPAIDLTAGERERGTLEVLMAAPVPRLWLLLAKLAAVWTVSLLTALVNLSMMTLTILAMGLGPLLFGPDGVTVLLVSEVLGLLVLFALFFSAVLLCLTSFARSFKEAQAYLVPLMLLSLAPGVATLLPDLSLRGPLAVTPLMNVVLLARDLFANNAEPRTALIVVISTLVYAALALTAAAYLFGAEAVLYSDHAGWRDLLRRPNEARDTASLNAALLCLALLFTSQFLLSRLIALAGLTPWAGAVLLTLLFFAFPVLGAVRERVRLVSGFGLTGPPALGMAGGLFLGLSLWPFAALLGLLIKQYMPQTLEVGVGDQVKRLIAMWRESGVALPLLLIALLPAVAEELLFRGYLFGALIAVFRPRNAILISALLFGVFHVFLGGLLSWERLLVTGLLGLVLGWIRWRTASIWPGMLLHACHNGILVLAALAKEGSPLQIQDLNWGSLLPWLGAGAAGAIGGVILVIFGRRAGSRKRPEETRPEETRPEEMRIR